MIEDEDPEIIYKAKWLQQRIYDRGLEGIHYMETAEQSLRANGESIVKRRLERDLPDEI